MQWAGSDRADDSLGIPLNNVDAVRPTYGPSHRLRRCSGWHVV